MYCPSRLCNHIMEKRSNDFFCPNCKCTVDRNSPIVPQDEREPAQVGPVADQQVQAAWSSALAGPDVWP